MLACAPGGPCVHRASVAIVGVLAVVGSCLAASPARAEGRTHEGFQFRGAVGAGYMSDSESSDAALHGGAGAAEVYLGGMPIRGLAIGGFLSGATAVGPSATADGFSVSDSNTSLTLVTIGPYIDFYPDPHRGLHILGTLGLARLTASYDDGNFSARNSATGFTLGGGIGYDWWVSRDWTVGILARLTFAGTTRTVDNVSTSESTVLPALLFSFSYN
jgi:hypothetical protein